MCPLLYSQKRKRKKEELVTKLMSEGANQKRVHGEGRGWCSEGVGRVVAKKRVEIGERKEEQPSNWSS